MRTPPDLPALPVSIPTGIWMPPHRGDGRLVIGRDAIVLELNRVTRWLTGIERVIQTDRTAVLVTARLLPPWMSTTLVVKPGSEPPAYAVMLIWHRRRLRSALREAGFAIDERATWLTIRPGPRSLLKTWAGQP